MPVLVMHHHFDEGYCWRCGCAWENRIASTALCPRANVDPVRPSREILRARIADLLRRSGVDEAEMLIRLLEIDERTMIEALRKARMYVLIQIGEGDEGDHEMADAMARRDDSLIVAAIRGDLVGQALPRK